MDKSEVIFYMYAKRKVQTLTKFLGFLMIYNKNLLMKLYSMYLKIYLVKLIKKRKMIYKMGLLD